MELSIDFGGSTVDMVSWDGDEISDIRTFESSQVPLASLEDFFQEADVELDDFEKIYVTGGKSRFFEGDFVKTSEIDAIGKGGAFLVRKQKAEIRSGVSDDEKFLVVSMGTGTCMVAVDPMEKGDSDLQAASCKLQATHIGGTGVGGGTFLGLGRELLGAQSIPELLEIGSRGSSKKVDLAVKDIVGGDIGKISGEATASNLGRLAREIEFSREDLAAGIINLIGQSVGASAAFAAQAEEAEKVVLIGKLIRAEAITEVVKEILESFGFEVLIPRHAQCAVAIGARVARNPFRSVRSASSTSAPRAEDTE